MAIVQVKDATGSVLDWMVAKCEFDTPTVEGGIVHAALDYMPFQPSIDWFQGGPIIEREGIELRPNKFGATGWTAWTLDRATKTQARNVGKSASTPLIAAMRCYVSSVLGHEVEVPDELI